MALDLNAPITWAGAQSLSRAAWDWWRRELAELVPASWRARATSHRGPELTLGDSGWFASGFSATFDGPLVARRDLLSSLATAARGREATIVLAASSIFSRAVTVPAGALGRLSEIIKLQIDRLSPLSPEETLWAAAVQKTPAGDAQGHCIMADRAEVSAISRELRAAGFHSFRVVDPATRAILYREDKNQPARRLLLGSLWGAAILLLLLALGLSVWRTEARIGEVQDRIAEVRPKAETVAAIRREALATKEISAALAETARKWSPLSVWAEVTRLLPDGAWLSALDVSGNSVRLEGYAKVSSEVLSALAVSEVLEAPVFEGALQRQPDLAADRFVLRAGVRAVTAQ